MFDVDTERERAQAQGLEPNGFSFDGADSADVDDVLNRHVTQILFFLFFFSIDFILKMEL